MSLVTTCGRCQDFLRLDEHMLGQRIRCPMCHNVFTASAATPFEEIEQQRKLVEASRIGRSQTRPWCSSTPLFEAEPEEHRPRSEPQRRRDRSWGDRDNRQVRARPVHTPPDPYRRPGFLYFLAVVLPLGLPLLLLLFVPGGIVSSTLACGLGLPVAMVTVLGAILLILPRWPLARRSLLSLGTIGIAYVFVLIILITQWVSFTSGASSRGTMAKGMKGGAKISSPSFSSPRPWSMFTPPDGDFTVRLPADVQDGILATAHGSLGKKVQFQAEDPATHLVYTAGYAQVDPAWLDIVSTQTFAQDRRDRVSQQGKVFSDDNIFVIGEQGRQFSVELLGQRQHVERVFYVRNRARVYFLSVSGPQAEVARFRVADEFFESFKLGERPVGNDRPAVVDIPDLAAYWPFDEGAGNRARETRFGFDGTLSNATWTDGRWGNALSFDATRKSYVDLGIQFNMAATRGFTIAGWIRTTSNAGSVVSLRKDKNKDEQSITLAVEGGALVASVYGDSKQVGLPPRVRSNMDIHDGRWHHFALTRDAGATIALYVDGQMFERRSNEKSRGAISASLRYLGREPSIEALGAQAYFSGSIDEFCIFTRELTADEIGRLQGKK